MKCANGFLMELANDYQTGAWFNATEAVWFSCLLVPYAVRVASLVASQVLIIENMLI